MLTCKVTLHCMPSRDGPKVRLMRSHRSENKSWDHALFFFSFKQIKPWHFLCMWRSRRGSSRRVSIGPRMWPHWPLPKNLDAQNGLRHGHTLVQLLVAQLSYPLPFNFFGFLPSHNSFLGLLFVPNMTTILRLEMYKKLNCNNRLGGVLSSLFINHH